MKPQNQLNRMYIQNLNYIVVDGRYSKGLFDAFRKTVAKAHHDCNNNILTIITDTNTMTLSMEKRIMVHPSQTPRNLDDTYD
jgi:hypothetical protein